MRTALCRLCRGVRAISTTGAAPRASASRTTASAAASTSILDRRAVPSTSSSSRPSRSLHSSARRSRPAHSDTRRAEQQDETPLLPRIRTASELYEVAGRRLLLKNKDMARRIAETVTKDAEKATVLDLYPGQLAHLVRRPLVTSLSLSARTLPRQCERFFCAS